jgi:hypothetical protein
MVYYKKPKWNGPVREGEGRRIEECLKGDEEKGVRIRVRKMRETVQACGRFTTRDQEWERDRRQGHRY